MKLSLSSVFALAIASLACACVGAAQQLVLNDQQATITVPKSGVSMDLSAIDKTVDPCTDFYAYACGNWRKNNPIPADQASWGRFDELQERNTYTLYTLMKDAAEHPKTPLQTKYGNYFAACMNDDLAEKQGTTPLKPQLDMIAAWKDKAELARLTGKLEDSYGVGLFYGFSAQQDQKDSTKQIPYIMQGGLTLPDRDYYLVNDERMTKIRAAYVEHVTNIFKLFGDTPEKAAAEAQAVLTIETAFAQAALPRVELRDPANRYHMTTLAEVQTATPHYKWADYLAAMHIPVTTLNDATPKFFTAFDAALASASIDDLKSYMRWHVMNNSARLLTKAIDTETFHFTQILTGQKEQAPRWKRCTMNTDNALGEAVGQDWVAKYFTPEAKANMDELIKQLEAALGDDIKGLDWMSATTKVEALKKLAAFRQKVGYPETWRDYSSITVKRDDRVGNASKVAVFDDRHELHKIGKPVDEKEWGMTPPTVNAYYSGSNNDINFPAGILQPPFFDAKIDPAVNYGGIGVVIGHEMTHGFDDQGSKYDPQGNVRQWWTDADRTEFNKRTDCEANEYGNFEAAPGLKLNGKLTLGENTADNGGLKVAYMALHKELAKTPGADAKVTDGYTQDQRFYLGFAQVFCENLSDEMARMYAHIDTHSPGQWRINGTVQNSQHFADAFSCKQGKPMVSANACHVW